jgi:hypothetical protein
MNLVTPTVLDIYHIALRMRDDEQAQYLAWAQVEQYDPDEATRMVLSMMGEVNFALLDENGEAYCVGGFTESRPKVWQSWMMGTDDGWKNHWREITKASRRIMDTLLASDRCHRIHDYSLVTRTAAHRWYVKGLGMKFSHNEQKWFSDGQDAACYIRVKE